MGLLRKGEEEEEGGGANPAHMVLPNRSSSGTKTWENQGNRSQFSSFLSSNAETVVQALIVYDTGGVNIEVAVDPSCPLLLQGTVTGAFSYARGGGPCSSEAAHVGGEGEKAFGDEGGGRGGGGGPENVKTGLSTVPSSVHPPVGGRGKKGRAPLGGGGAERGSHLALATSPGSSTTTGNTLLTNGLNRTASQDSNSSSSLPQGTLLPHQAGGGGHDWWYWRYSTAAAASVRFQCISEFVFFLLFVAFFLSDPVGSYK